MIIDYLTLIVPGLVVGIAVVIGNIIGNIIYYKYTSSKEKNIKFLKMQITELLLPLYVELKNWESSAEALRGYPILEGCGINKGIIDETITKKLYLASPKLSNLLLEYLNCEYLRANSVYRDAPIDYQKIIDDYEELKATIFKEYEKKVREYQRLYGS